MNMTLMREEEKPWKTDLARKAAQRREQVAQELEETIKKAPSFEEALRQAVEGLRQCPLSIGIDGAGRFIQDQQARIGQLGSCQRNQLTFAHRQVLAAGADVSGEAIG